MEGVDGGDSDAANQVLGSPFLQPDRQLDAAESHPRPTPIASPAQLPADCRLLIKLPSGTTFPMTASLAATVVQLKEAVTRHCGWTREQLPATGIALGLSALREELSLAANDVASGDTLTVFLRTQ